MSDQYQYEVTYYTADYSDVEVYYDEVESKRKEAVAKLQEIIQQLCIIQLKPDPTVINNAATCIESTANQLAQIARDIKEC